MGSVWVLFLLLHIPDPYILHILQATYVYTARITATITPIQCSLIFIAIAVI